MTDRFFIQLKEKFEALADEFGLRDAAVNVKASLLSPEDSIGITKRKDYVILAGKERLLQAEVLGCKGQAFTGAQGDFSGTLKDVLELPLTDDFQRAIYIATLNAVVCHTKKEEQTIHCRNEGPERCAQQAAEYFREHYQDSRILMIGYQPALAEAISGNGIALTVLDLDPANIGKTKNGVLIKDGSENLEQYISEHDVIFATGSTVCNATIEPFYNAPIPLVLFGTTGAGAAALLGIERFCPESTCGNA
jgi:hypothetical protein